MFPHLSSVCCHGLSLLRLSVACVLLSFFVYIGLRVFPMCLDWIHDWTKMSWLFRGTLLVFWTLVWRWQESRQGEKARAEGMEALNESHLDIPFPIGGKRVLIETGTKWDRNCRKRKWTVTKQQKIIDYVGTLRFKPLSIPKGRTLALLRCFHCSVKFGGRVGSMWTRRNYNSNLESWERSEQEQGG